MCGKPKCNDEFQQENGGFRSGTLVRLLGHRDSLHNIHQCESDELRQLIRSWHGAGVIIIKSQQNQICSILTKCIGDAFMLSTYDSFVVVVRAFCFGGQILIGAGAKERSLPKRLRYESTHMNQCSSVLIGCLYGHILTRSLEGARSE
ncbi:hypothetical protein ACJX0J_027255, partial [Zea mays]